MKTIVVYQSKTGYTKTYAEWIAAALSCEAVEYKRAEQLDTYDTIVYGGGVYVGKINGLDLFLKQCESFNNKQIIVWGTGLSPVDSAMQEELWQHNLPAEQKKKVQVFYLQGGLNYNKLGLVDKILIRAVSFMLKKQGKQDGQVQMPLQKFKEPTDFRAKDNIRDLLKSVGRHC